jgi:hypothetical protein
MHYNNKVAQAYEARGEHLFESKLRAIEHKRQANSIKKEVSTIQASVEGDVNVEMFIIANRRIARSVLTIWALGYTTSQVADRLGSPFNVQLVDEILKQHINRLRVPLIKFLFKLHDNTNRTVKGDSNE